jgi:hypothetical protein
MRLKAFLSFFFFNYELFVLRLFRRRRRITERARQKPLIRVGQAASTSDSNKAKQIRRKVNDNEKKRSPAAAAAAAQMLAMRRLPYDSSPFISSPVILSRSSRLLVISYPVISSPGHLVPWSFCHMSPLPHVTIAT